MRLIKAACLMLFGVTLSCPVLATPSKPVKTRVHVHDVTVVEVPVGSMIPYFGNRLPDDNKWAWAAAADRPSTLTAFPSEPTVPVELRGAQLPDIGVDYFLTGGDRDNSVYNFSGGAVGSLNRTSGVITNDRYHFISSIGGINTLKDIAPDVKGRPTGFNTEYGGNFPNSFWLPMARETYTMDGMIPPNTMKGGAGWPEVQPFRADSNDVLTAGPFIYDRVDKSKIFVGEVTKVTASSVCDQENPGDVNDVHTPAKIKWAIPHVRMRWIIRIR